MSKMLSFLLGAVLGGAIGGMASLTMTPGSGDEMREKLRNGVQEVINEGRRAAEARREELEKQLENMRQSTNA